MNDTLLSGEDDYYRGFLSFYRLLNAVKWADGVDLLNFGSFGSVEKTRRLAHVSCINREITDVFISVGPWYLENPTACSAHTVYCLGLQLLIAAILRLPPVGLA